MDCGGKGRGTYVDFYDVGRDDSFEDELGDSVACVYCGRHKGVSRNMFPLPSSVGGTVDLIGAFVLIRERRYAAHIPQVALSAPV